MFSWSARSYAALSISAALLTMAIKFAAYLLTGSVGLLSDAAESLVNLAAALIAFWALGLAARPPDEEHAYGHTKAEYFSSGAEGALILLAAATIVYAAVPRLIHPQPIERPGLGLALAVVGAVINGAVGWVLLTAGRRLRSISLEADARHLFTDVWTTAAVIVAVFLVVVTGVERLDPDHRAAGRGQHHLDRRAAAAPDRPGTARFRAPRRRSGAHHERAGALS